MIATLVLLGATGDLAGRFLFPALAMLQPGHLPKNFRVVGAARNDLDDRAFRDLVADRLDRFAGAVSPEAREAFLKTLSYREVDLADPDSVSGLVRAATPQEAGPIVVYVALPQGVFSVAIASLAKASLPRGSRIAIEKPFGEDLEGAKALNGLLDDVASVAGDAVPFRVDHVLGMPTVANLVGIRQANPLLDAVWDAENIEQIDLLWEETLALENRVGFYDKAGALKDVIQNHVMQLLSLVAMEPPTRLDEHELRDRKVRALRAVRTLTPEEVAARTRRARYGAGRLADSGGADGRAVPAYRKEQGVDAGRETETFAEIELEIDSPRWAGTRFVLRAGKALAARRKGILVRFRSPRRPDTGPAAPPPNQLWIGIDGPNDITLQITGRTAGPPASSQSLKLSAEPPPSDLSAYAHVLLNILTGDSTLSVRGDEAEEAWRIVTPVLEGWAKGIVQLEEYPAGSTGP